MERRLKEVLENHGGNYILPFFWQHGEVYETAHVKVNGQDAGVRIAPPYAFEIGNLIVEGVNNLEVLVSNTLVHELRDYMSMTLPMEPSGLLGPVTIQY